MAERIERNRRAIFADLSADQMEYLVAWFIESHDSGWRPQMFFPKDLDALHLKTVTMLVELKDFHRRREAREAERASKH